MKFDAQSVRKSALAKIHIAKSQLAMEDADYRAMLQRIAGVGSAADLMPHQVDAVLAEMRRLGFADPKGDGFDKRRAQRPYARKGNEAMMARIEKNLASGMLPWTYAEAMSKRMFGVQKLQWLSYENLRKLNAALEIAKRRRAAKASPSPRHSRESGNPAARGAGE
ncbi:MAG: regulatory protein GemA [Proteobacteria bacterium]|nr:regulatory protein GemA [Pseudomonadota bacterium]MCL2306719.1 regulatory protein GemA [Pseudomonadota bacterium]